MLVLAGLLDFIEPFNYSSFSITCQGSGLDYCDIDFCGQQSLLSGKVQVCWFWLNAWRRKSSSENLHAWTLALSLAVWILVSFWSLHPKDWQPESQDYEVEGCVLIFSCKNSKITTCSWTTSNKRMLDPTQKRYHMSKGKGEAPARWWKGWNRILSQTPYAPETLGWLKQILCTPGPRDPTEIEPELWM